MSIEILSAEYANEEKTLIDVQVVHPVFGEIPYTLNIKTADESLDAEIKEALKDIQIKEYVAPTKTDIQIVQENNAQILSQIDTLEKELIRPMRELLSTKTDETTKIYAQAKVDEIEAQIKTLRSQFVSVEEG